MTLLEKLKQKILERTGQPLAEDPQVAGAICEAIEEYVEERLAASRNNLRSGL